MWDNLQSSFLLLVVGMGGVLLSLYFLSVIIWLFNKVDIMLEKNKDKEANLLKDETSANNSGSAIAEHNEIDLEVIAAISAAILKTHFGCPVKVKRLRFLSDMSNDNWVNQGRASIMTSHQIERRTM